MQNRLKLQKNKHKKVIESPSQCMLDSQQMRCWHRLWRIETMMAQDASAKTDEQIQEDAMKVLIEILGGSPLVDD